MARNLLTGLLVWDHRWPATLLLIIYFRKHFLKMWTFHDIVLKVDSLKVGSSVYATECSSPTMDGHVCTTLISCTICLNTRQPVLCWVLSCISGSTFLCQNSCASELACKNSWVLQSYVKSVVHGLACEQSNQTVCPESDSLSLDLCYGQMCQRCSTNGQVVRNVDM